MQSQIQSLLSDPAWLVGWRQPSKISVSQWADDNRVLDERYGAWPGPWRTERAPYAREWMDSGSTRWVRRVSICASTQVGKSEALNNILGYYIAQQPAPLMFVVPRQGDIEVAMQRRIDPMVRSSPALRDEMTTRKRDAKMREIAFRRALLYLRAATSPADLASNPIRVALCDELDKWPDWSGKEASPLALVQSRTHTFPLNHLVVCVSTPTLAGVGISREFTRGDQRRYHVPCPHCETLQVLQWSRIKWPADVRTEREMTARRQVWYECASCGKAIEEKFKPAMLASGVWVPSEFTPQQWLAGERERDRDRTEHRSYHLWAAYSPWLSWVTLAAVFLRAQESGEPQDVMDFANSYLAEPWQDRVAAVTEAEIARSVDDEHHHGDCPEAVQVVTAAIDVQADRLEWSVHGWGYDEETWLLECGRVESWQDLRSLLFDRLWGPKQLRIRVALIDSRHRRDEVLQFARQEQVVRMIAGVERDSPVPFSTVRIEKHPRTGEPLPQAQIVWTINVGMFKDIAAARLRREDEAQKRGRIHLPVDLPADVVKQLASEHKVRQRSGGKARDRWVKRPGHLRNEAWDLLVYQLAAARLVRIDTLRSDRPATPPPAAPRPMRRGRRTDYPSFGGQ
jgi:phage terminase large subunit GpA-like protein